MVSREALDMARLWLEGAQQLKGLPLREAADRARRQSLERCLWLRSQIVQDREVIAGVSLRDSLRIEQGVLLGFRRARKTMMRNSCKGSISARAAR
jgi:hypothetical protein